MDIDFATLYKNGEYQSILEHSQYPKERKNVRSVEDLIKLKWRALVLWKLGKFEESKATCDLIENAIEMSFDPSKDDIVDIKAHIYRIYGNIQSFKRSEEDDNTTYWKKSLELANQVNNFKLAAVNLHNIGQSLVYKGHLEEGLKYFNKSVDINLEHDLNSQLSENYLALAETYLNLGELQKSFSYIKKADAIISEKSNPHSMGNIKQLYGTYYKLKGSLELSKKYYKEALNLFSDITAINIVILDLLFDVLLLKREFDEANRYLNKMKNIRSENTDIKLIDVIYKLNSALLLSRNPNFKDKAKALDLLNSVSEVKTNIRIEMKIFLAKINLLIDQLRLGYDANIIQEIRSSIKEMEVEVKANNDHISILRLSHLKSKLWVIEQKPQNAINILEEAIEYAQSRKLHVYEIILKHQKSQVKDDVIWWQNYIKSNKHVNERLKMDDLRSYIKKAKDLPDLPGNR